MQQKRAYKYRFYPTAEQARILARTFGCVRYVYNWALRARTDAYYQRKERLYYEHLAVLLTTLKQQEDTAWLSEVSSVPLQQSLRHLESAFRNFFDGRAKYPKFKKKHGPQAATYASSAFKWDGTALTLAKMDAPLAIRWSRPLPEGAKPGTVTITRDAAMRYFVSFLVEEEIAPLPISPKTVGMDLGLHDVVTLSTGEKTGNERYFCQEEKRLAHLQRRHARKRKGGKNREKARRKVARLHARIADRRKDFLHKLTTRLIRENQVICVESLQVKNMMQNDHLAKAIADVGWGELIRQLQYKADWYGRSVVAIDKWYPSSKRCHACGHSVDALSLAIRQWTCPECGTVHDRDTNAALNIEAAGLAVFACGETVRPGRVKTRSARSGEAGSSSR
ncbi:MAG TPA: RNA-guided endonuclease TnpB family protein [Ktedonobacterales bacterium]|nr:RNA-guided endonuclease TnpB family protein [Ktedonobacterales bacterium]